MRRGLLWLPFGVFALLFGVVAFGLRAPADRTIHSAMVGKQLPVFALPGIIQTKPGLDSALFHKGKPRLLNVFASWCIPCVAEAPNLMRLKMMGVPIDAIAIRDTGPAMEGFLRRNGDPYERIGDDKVSAVQLSLGSSGVPETFVVDGQGKIVQQHIGDIREEDIPTLLAALQGAQ